MARVITRYGGGSRKLYDTADSRYISLQEIPGLIRRGEVLRVVDNTTGRDVTGQVLAQVISASERRGVSLLSPETLHEIIRRSGEILVNGVRQLRREVNRLVAPGELEQLRHGLRQLERSLTVVSHRGRAAQPRTVRRPRGVRSARGVQSPIPD